MRINKNLLVLLFLLFIHHCLIAQQWPIREWPVATPQSQSMNADSLKAFDEAIAGGKYGIYRWDDHHKAWKNGLSKKL